MYVGRRCFIVKLYSSSTVVYFLLSCLYSVRAASCTPDGVMWFDGVTKCDGAIDQRLMLLMLAVLLSVVMLGASLLFAVYVQQVQETEPPPVFYIPQYCGVLVTSKASFRICFPLDTSRAFIDIAVLVFKKIVSLCE